MPSLTIITLGLTLAFCGAAFAQAANGPPAPLATKQAPAEAAQKRPTDVKTAQTNARPRNTDRPAIGPVTTQGLAQDSIARTNGR